MSSVQRSLSDPDFTRISSRAQTIEFDGVHETPLRFLADVACSNSPLPLHPPSEFQSRPPSAADQIQQRECSSLSADRLREIMAELNKHGLGLFSSGFVVCVAGRSWA